MESTEASVFGFEPNSTLVGLLEVMADVEEASSAEGITEVTDLGISGNKSCEPIVGNADGWNTLSLAAIFKHSFTEYSNLLHNVPWLSIWIWAWENITIVKEYNLHTFDHSFMDSKSETSANANMDVVNVSDASWVLCKVTCLALSVSLVVGGDNNDFLAEVGETNR